ncbi:hypothetical protein GCM10023328_37670 [Modestobacter marinus]|uniref:Uncharacterized protein n=1 Tax=Modestobacter marinus TaxID=477641 RepID=A0ABQ2G5B2_9ACTN|nr:hypothetical protein GCM10011589_34360 [Modestobacter marinus]
MTTGRKIEASVSQASRGWASRVPPGSLAHRKGRCQVRSMASCTSGGSTEASTTSAPAAEMRDRDRARRTAWAQQ